MKTILLSLLLAITSGALAQQTQEYKYVMEDGIVRDSINMDSLNRVWGEGCIMLQHNTEDDKKGIMHVVRLTDDMKKQFQEKAFANLRKLMAMSGNAAPSFSLKDMSGKTWKSDELKGKVVVLNFWFTSCPPCIAEMPELNKLVESNQSKEVVFLAFTYNDPGQVKTFLEKHTFNYTILPLSGEVDKSYSVSSWPTSFVIGKDGKVLFATGMTGPELIKQLQSSINSGL